MKSSMYIVSMAAILALSSCMKDPEQKGCTDPHSINYDPSALVDDGTCEYNKSEQVIWANGLKGGWNEDLHEGAYRLDVCEGIVDEWELAVDSANTAKSLYFGTGNETRHHSYFTLINERNAADFAEGSLRMDIRVSDNQEGAPGFFDLFISGKIHEDGTCEPYRRSEVVEISTHSFNDSTFTEVNVPIRHFEEIMMRHVEVVCGISFEGERNTGIEVDNIRWVANPY